ncbi:extracellular calcium-sensing receptor-like [Lissotriton helveticus]
MGHGQGVHGVVHELAQLCCPYPVKKVILRPPDREQVGFGPEAKTGAGQIADPILPWARKRPQSQSSEKNVHAQDGSTAIHFNLKRLPWKYLTGPEVSYFSSSPVLSDRSQFPSFFRTIPNDEFQSRGLAELVMYFGWSWVGLLAEDSDYGQHGIQIMKEQLIQAGVCIAFSENILTGQLNKNAIELAQLIKMTSANAIAIFSLDEYLLPVLDELIWLNVTGKIWIASEAWSTSTILSMDKYSVILKGTIGFAIHSGEMPGFKEYLQGGSLSRSSDDLLLRTFGEEAFRCTWQDFNPFDNKSNSCTGLKQRDGLNNVSHEMPDWRVSYNVYTAVYAIAWALRDLFLCRPQRGPFHYGSCGNIMDFQPWQLLHYLKNIKIDGEDGSTHFFDRNGNPLAQYDVVNWQLGSDGTLKHVNVGSFDSRAPSGKNLLLNASTIVWPLGSAQVPLSVCSPSCPPGFRKVTRKGQPACCFQCILCPPGEISNQTDSIDCLKCPVWSWPSTWKDQCIPKTIDFLTYDEPLGGALTALNVFFSLITMVILSLFIHSRETPIVKANNRSLSYLLLLSLTVCFLSSLAFIGYPTAKKCLLRQVAFGITFALCISCILAKTIMVVIAFNATKPNSELRRWAGPELSYSIIIICTLIQVLLCAFWLAFIPPFPEYIFPTQPGYIIVECNEGSHIAFWCMLGYLWLLASISFIVAFLARKLPDTFNEAKLITFSMLAFLSVWLSFVPAYLSTKGKYMVAMEIFSILCSSCALVSCIFFPKCYTILFQPQKNSRRHLLDMGRG